jgi:integrase
MITFEPCIRSLRSDGYAVVYIRIIKDTKPTYIKTSYIVSKKQISGKKIKDFSIISEISPIIKKYIDKLNKVDTENWDIKEVVEFLLKDKEEISFSDFLQIFVNRMINSGRENPTKNYTTAHNSLQKFTGKTNLLFSDITSKTINEWIKSLSGTNRAKSSYPSHISTVFKAGQLEFNDYDRDIIRITNQPFMRVEIPRPDKGKKKAVSTDILRKLFTQDLSEYPRKKNAPLAKDVMLMSFCLAGINTADLYFLEKQNLKDWKLCYSRHKTESKREDNAYFEITIPTEIRPLFEKYKGKNKLFSFSEMYSENNSFNKYLNQGLKDLCEIAKVEDVSTYTFRHSWATIAQNQCGASTEQVGFALNHSSAHRITEGYIKKDFSPIDVLNKKVIKCVFGEVEKLTKKKKKTL